VKLTDLNPVWTTPVGGHEPNGVQILVLDCPCGRGHRLRLPLGSPGQSQRTDTETGCFVWQRDSNDFATLTLYPSVRTSCCHVHISKGEVTRAKP
jgi:hypothetical protein